VGDLVKPSVFKDFDVLIVGAGLAGLSTAYFLRDLSDYKIAVATKVSDGYGSSTFYSQGAFRCPGSSYGRESYVKDTLEGGRHINRRYLVELLASECRDSILSLERAGIRFAETRTGLQVVSDDVLFPGREIVTKLSHYLLGRGVEFLEWSSLIDIARLENGGYLALFTSRNSLVSVGAKAVVLATGGAANAYSRSDNPSQLACEGHGLALRLGLPLVDMEFVQFHPLGIAEPGRPSIMAPPFRNGKLVNKLGEDIIVKYGLESLGKAYVLYRDALSRAMMLEVREGRGVDGALLLYPEVSEEESRAVNAVKRLGLPIPMRVMPVAHYTMGGVEVGKDLRTELPGLYVVGELIGGVHGANRLGGNALTACVTFSKLVAADLLNYVRKEFDRGGVAEPRNIEEITDMYSSGEGGPDPADIRSRIRELMWSKVGVLRDGDGLEEAVETLYQVLDTLRTVKIGNVRDLTKLREAESTALTSLAIATSALRRKESRGAHYRLDYPEESNSWLLSIKTRMRDGKLIISEEPLT